ncbi:hypothetical protein [Sedimentibacter sp.]|uniref:hypothetical protein n=1 Tax=Sedimentibacter sp. TaxID=1960295 RepID=UPI0028A0AC08|nr:hypothetical protein [Sedimentibacter sp.]
MYKILGIINVVLIIVITSPYWLRRISKLLFPDKKIASTQLMKTARAVHKPLGICLLLITLVHGYMALGAPRLHTGTLVGTMVLITVVLGGAFFRTKKAVFFKWHKRAALITILLTLLHLIAPNAVYYITNLM